MKFFDLFAGIGGFRLGMERNGHECIGSCEIDKYARQIYAKNFGQEPEYRDATKLNPKELPDFQCLCAGFPCQSFSLAGQRGGFEDTRGTLFFEIIRIAREKQPSILFLENVKGLLSHDKGKTYRTILTTLDEVGYDCEFMLVNSKYFVPQNRERIFIICHLRGSGRRKILPLREISERYDNSCKESGKNGKKLQNQCDSEESTALTTSYYKGWGGGRTMISEPKAKHINMTEHNGSRVYSKDGIAPSVMAGEGSGTRIKIAEAKSIQRCGDREKKTYSFSDISHCLCANPTSDYQNKIIEPNVKQIGKIHKGQSGTVYSTDGIATTICGCGGGDGAKTGLYAEPKIKKVGCIGKDGQGNRVYSVDGVAPTLNALSGGMGAKTGLYAIGSTQKHTAVMKDMSPTLTEAMGKGGGHVPMVLNPDEKKMVYTSNTNANMKKRIQDRESTWTLTGNGTDFGLVEGCRIRRLTPKECERLQGFPDGWTDHEISDTQRYKCLGNAVTTTTIQYIASFL